MAAHAVAASPTPVPASPRDRATPGGSLRILLAERRASAHSELSRRLKSRGHEVLARVTSAQGAIDYAGFLAPDVVLVSPVLEDTPGLTVAMAVAKKQPGVAAVVLTSHPAAADPTSRPRWGSVALLPVDAEADEMHEELWRAVMQARETSSVAELSPATGTEPDALAWSPDAGALEDQSIADVARALLFDVDSDTIEVVAPGE